MNLYEFDRLRESSGYSLEGSFTPDLVFSKYWLMQQLDKIKPKISTAYILGSWYGNMALYLARYGQPQVQTIINVEPDAKFLSTSKKILDKFGIDNVQYIKQDANDLNYSDLDNNSVVINTSLTDMQGRNWFDQLPQGTLVALQARDHDPGFKFSSADDILTKFPLQQVLYSGSMNLQDPQTEYTRFMVIGRK
jgi:protein-L-isoaspartate O-methyltransferase